MRALAVTTIKRAASAKSLRKESRVRQVPFCKSCDKRQVCTWPGKFKLGTSNSL